MAPLPAVLLVGASEGMPHMELTMSSAPMREAIQLYLNPSQPSRVNHTLSRLPYQMPLLMGRLFLLDLVILLPGTS